MNLTASFSSIGLSEGKSRNLAIALDQLEDVIRILDWEGESLAAAHASMALELLSETIGGAKV
jgi:hypothetical protein